MGWSQEQRRRLNVEKGILEKYFPGRVKWIDPTGDTKVEVELKTNNGNRYRLRVYLTGDFPNSLPDMVVSDSPKPMPDWSGSSSHTLGKRDGFLRLCHYRSSRWTAQSSIYEVFMKGRIWLEAYEGHLRTGKNMDYFLGEMH